MSNTTTQTITTDSQTVLNTVNSILPVLESYVPAVGQNAALIQIGMSAASALIPLINLIPTGGTVSVADQAALLARVNAIINTPLTGPEWQVQS